MGGLIEPMNNSSPANDISHNQPIATALPDQSINPIPKKDYKLRLILIILLAFVAILPVSLYLFFTYDGRIILSPLKTNDPYVLQVDIKYTLQAKIMQVTELPDGVELTTDIPEFSKVKITNRIPVITGWESTDPRRVPYRELKVNQNIKIAMDYIFKDKQYKVVSVLIDRE